MSSGEGEKIRRGIDAPADGAGEDGPFFKDQVQTRRVSSGMSPTAISSRPESDHPSAGHHDPPAAASEDLLLLLPEFKDQTRPDPSPEDIKERLEPAPAAASGNDDDVAVPVAEPQFTEQLPSTVQLVSAGLLQDESRSS